MARQRKNYNPTVMKYCEDVLSGRQIAGKYTRLAVERFLSDIESGRDRGLALDHKTGERVINFFHLLRHHKGQLAGKPIHLEPHQQFYVYNLFGWKRENGTRRFRRSYKEVARKNGKTTECAGKAMFTTTLDGEQGAQVYFVATKEEQARIGFDDVWKIARKTPGFEFRKENPDGLFEVFKKSVFVPYTGSFIKPVGSDSKTQDGFDPHHAIIDEYHEHKTDGMLHVMSSGMGARRQPLIDIITTAGFNKTYPCYGYRKLVTDVLEGRVSNDALFGLIFTLDDDDDWQNTDVWGKANPNLGASIYLDNLKDDAKEALDRGGEALVNFQTKNLNKWMDAAKTWIQHEKWVKYGKTIDREALRGRKCYGGLDLSATQDFTAFSLIFPMPDGTFQLLVWLWIPEDTVKARIDAGLSDLRKWINDGWVKTCPGGTINYNQITSEILAYCKYYKVESIARDPWNSTSVVQDLEAELPPRTVEGKQISRLTDFVQGIKTFATPTKEFEKMVLEQRLQHGNNPVLTWMLSNVAIRTDASGNQRPDKEKSNEKIDGIVAGIMALGEFLTWNWQATGSVYEERGLRDLG